MPPFYTRKFPKKIFRRPIFYITVIVVPIFLISTLSILGIFTPGSSDGPRGEKVSLGLGSLLAMTVLLGIVAGVSFFNYLTFADTSYVNIHLRS